MDGIPFSSSRRSAAYPLHRPLATLVLTICLLLLGHAYLLEPFQVPTGSMAPMLLGHHRSGACPRCGFPVDMGRSYADGDGSGGERCYLQATCPNCGCTELHLGRVQETKGDHVLVNKSVYALRRPRRWEVIVFRLFGKTFIKRLIGLGGEEIELVDGDIHIGGKLARKTFDEFLGMRVLVFENDYAPVQGGWKQRWEYEPENAAPLSPKQPLTVDGRGAPQKLTYCHFSLDERKCVPIVNEYAYNGANPRSAEPVHDFMAETELEIVEGNGTLALALADGELEVEVQIGVGDAREVAVGAQFKPIADCRFKIADLNANLQPAICNLKSVQNVRLLAGKRYHIEMALVDRRLTLRVDGRDVFAPLDMPEAKERAPVVRPLRFTAGGVVARLHHVRLYRDVHYSQLGKNGVHGRRVRLAIDQAFVLGDNSPNSEDSRFWPNQGAVPMNNLVGRAFLVHLPSRTVAWQSWGREWRCQLPDWERVRWVR